MSAVHPRNVITSFAAHVTAGRVDELTELYEPDAIYLARPGEPVSGVQIRAAFTRLAAMKPIMTGAMERALIAGDIALVNNSWRVRATYPGGKPLRTGGVSAVVLRRRPDGTWGVLIDDPWALPGPEAD